MARQARAAAEALAEAPTEAKNAALLGMAAQLRDETQKILAANEEDIAEARESGTPSELLNRLGFGEPKIRSRITALEHIAGLPDPVGETETVHEQDGLRAAKRRVPIGVIGVIYEARPHVTVNAGALCVKAGNAVVLKGGSEALHCNRLLGELWQAALDEAGLPKEAVQVLGTSDREAVRQLLSLHEHVDLIIPRGGPGLIRTVTEQTRIPVVKHSHGICHLYVDAGADLEQALKIAVDSKTYAPAVCNALETLLVHRGAADEFLPALGEAMLEAGVTLRGCPQTRERLPAAEPADEEDWDTEYLDLILAVRIVPSIEEAMAHIAQHGSGHSDAIVSEDRESVRRFVAGVDSGVVLVNASTMFNDGSKLGMGAEIGISSDKIHARGPMGLRELTCQKWVIEGDGHTFGEAA
jgi:glutamate-5-semialdehyde dehydrogenase